MAHKNKGSLAAVKSGTALHEVLAPHKDAILERWKGVVHGTYPFDTIGFLRTKTDQFSNPVGHRTEKAAEAIGDVIFSENPDIEALQKAIDEIVQVRAVQIFSPENAVGIFFALKDIVRDVVNESGRLEECAHALLAMESRVDSVALVAFGIYARYREKLHLIRVEEVKRGISQIKRFAIRHGMENNDK